MSKVNELFEKELCVVISIESFLSGPEKAECKGSPCSMEAGSRRR